MNGEEAIRLIQAHMIAHNIGVYPHIRLAKALDMAISALRQQKVESKLKVVESNEPLTLDELRQMDGEPVWLVGLENGDRWAHIDSIDSLVIRFSMFGNSETWCFRTASYGVRVWAYHQKQKEN